LRYQKERNRTQNNRVVFVLWLGWEGKAIRDGGLMCTGGKEGHQVSTGKGASERSKNRSGCKNPGKRGESLFPQGRNHGWKFLYPPSGLPQGQKKLQLAETPKEGKRGRFGVLKG